MIKIGVANKTESNLSKTPPCPGNSVPLSLMPAARFNKDSNKSPKVANIIIKQTAIKPFQIGVKLLINIKTKYNAIVMIVPPINPSHDFLGDILGHNLCFPKRVPTKYANVS